MKFGLTKKDIKYIREIFFTFPEVWQAIIFGSRAMGNYKNGSDVDIALKGENISHETITKIKYILNEELALPYFFDVVHYETLKNENLIKHVDNFGKILFSRNSKKKFE